MNSILLAISMIGLLFGVIALFHRSSRLQALRQQANYYAEMENESKEYADKLINKINQLNACNDKEQGSCDRIVDEILLMLRYSEIMTRRQDLASLRAARPSPERTKQIAKYALEAAEQATLDAKEYSTHKQFYQR